MAKMAKIQVRPSRMTTPTAPRKRWIVEKESDLVRARWATPISCQTTRAKAVKLMAMTTHTGATKATWKAIPWSQQLSHTHTVRVSTVDEQRNGKGGDLENLLQRSSKEERVERADREIEHTAVLHLHAAV